MEYFCFSDILKRVQLGQSIKDIVAKYPRRVCLPKRRRKKKSDLINSLRTFHL